MSGMGLPSLCFCLCQSLHSHQTSDTHSGVDCLLWAVQAHTPAQVCAHTHTTWRACTDICTNLLCIPHLIAGSWSNKNHCFRWQESTKSCGIMLKRVIAVTSKCYFSWTHSSLYWSAAKAAFCFTELTIVLQPWSVSFVQHLQMWLSQEIKCYRL